jgi:hypothetical protein
MARVVRSRIELEKSHIGRLIERLARTSFRDRDEREILVAELGRTIAELPCADERRAVGTADGEQAELISDSIAAVATVESDVRALAAPDSTDAWANRIVRLERDMSLLLAAEEDLLEARARTAEAEGIAA